MDGEKYTGKGKLYIVDADGVEHYVGVTDGFTPACKVHLFTEEDYSKLEERVARHIEKARRYSEIYGMGKERWMELVASYVAEAAPLRPVLDRNGQKSRNTFKARGKRW